MALDTLQLQNPVPSDAVPVQGYTAADVVDTTPVDILPTPSNTAQSYYVHEVIAVNKTTAEDPVIELLDDTGTPIVLAAIVPAKPTGVGLGHYKFARPLVVAPGKKLRARATTAVGDTRVTAIASRGTPGLLG